MRFLTILPLVENYKPVQLSQGTKGQIQLASEILISTSPRPCLPNLVVDDHDPQDTWVALDPPDHLLHLTADGQLAGQEGCQVN